MYKNKASGSKSAKRRIIVLVLLAVVAFVALTTMFVVWELRDLRADGVAETSSDSLSVNESAILADYGALVDFTFTERSGAELSREDLRGMIWIADFIFTNCAGPCPLMTARMAELQEAFSDVGELRLVSFSVDPERDTPEVLREYADRYGAHPERWLFLTGDLSEIVHVAVDGFQIGKRDDPLLHSTRFVLVDQQGHIRGYYDSEEPGLISKVRHDLNILLVDPPA